MKLKALIRLSALMWDKLKEKFVDFIVYTFESFGAYVQFVLVAYATGVIVIVLYMLWVRLR